MTIDHETCLPGTPSTRSSRLPRRGTRSLPGYAEHVAPGEQPVSAAALDLVGLKADETFLDVAAGPGGLGLAAARLGATVLATDWAPAMVAQFESRARSERLANARRG